MLPRLVIRVLRKKMFELEKKKMIRQKLLELKMGELQSIRGKVAPSYNMSTFTQARTKV